MKNAGSYALKIARSSFLYENNLPRLKVSGIIPELCFKNAKKSCRFTNFHSFEATAALLFLYIKISIQNRPFHLIPSLLYLIKFRIPMQRGNKLPVGSYSVQNSCCWQFRQSPRPARTASFPRLPKPDRPALF